MRNTKWLMLLSVSWLIIGMESLVLNNYDKQIQRLENALNEQKVINADHVPTVILIPIKTETPKPAMNVTYTPKVSDAEVDMLAHLISGEAGAEWCSDYMQLAVGSVVLNRIAHESFPDTMQEVIYQDGQYACTWNGAFDKEPDERAYNNSKYLLEHGSVFPSDVIWQANFKQGEEVYAKIQNMYFCR